MQRESLLAHILHSQWLHSARPHSRERRYLAGPVSSVLSDNEIPQNLTISRDFFAGDFFLLLNKWIYP